ncbi:MAG: AAA family ATPase [Chitinophagales bacterium]
MEDWSKYIFDPKNPKDFKAYKLLKNIFKDNNTLLITDMYYFNELFKKEIWTQDMIDELWDDIPSDFSDLAGNKKYSIYIKNYSRNKYIEKIKNKADEVRKSRYTRLFNHFAWNLETKAHNINHTYTFASHQYLMTEQIDNFSSKFQRAITQKSRIVEAQRNCIFTISSGFIFHLIPNLSTDRVSVFFCNEKNTTQLNEIKSLKNLHPIILKKDEDIHQLLDFIIRDLNNETQTKPIHQPKTYLNEINIKNYFSIENISIQDLGNKKEIYLMGENGDGKTILLQAIVLALRGNQNVGTVTDVVKQNTHKKMSLLAETSDGKKYIYSENPKNQKNSFSPVFGYGIDRFRNDSDKIDKVGYLSLFDKETYLENPEKWLQHLDYKETKGDTSEISLSQAKEILIDILERDVTIDVTPDKVTFTEKGSALNFSQLSDGYQSVIIWVCDLIARLSALQPNVSSTHDYSGVVILDEIGAYLHPKWAYEIVKKLREWFPNLQFIFTTHNPIVILGASEDAAFYKVYKEDGKTKVSEPVEDISDLMLNSLVTSPLFNLPTARPKGFDESNDLSSDDYVYRRIHQLIQEKLQTMPNLVDEDVMKMIEAELEKM